MAEPRGIRCHNPGNIRIGTPWLGLSPTPKDKEFCTFISPEYGIRAMMIIFNTYAKRGLNTVQKVISTWAPATENNTQAYVAAVRNALGKDAITQKDYIPLAKAIVKHENGKQPYSNEVFQEAFRLAKLPKQA